jgi:hypothetical protein
MKKELLFYFENASTTIADDRFPFFNGFGTKYREKLFFFEYFNEAIVGLGDLKEIGISVITDLAGIGDEKFFYPILISMTGFSEIVDHLELSEEILTKIKTKQCKILLVSNLEGFPWNIMNSFASSIVKRFGLDDESIAFLTGNAEPNPRISNVYFNTWEFTSDQMFKWQESRSLISRCTEMITTRSKRYDFICLNRRSHYHRLAIVGGLYPFRHRGLLSLHRNVDEFSDSFAQSLSRAARLFPDLYQNWITHDIQSALPLVLPRELDSGNPAKDNPVCDQEIDKFLLSKLHIVNETTTNYEPNNHLFLSEKIFKPIAFMQPFVLIGPAHSLKLLRSFGYQTFSYYIDESYDDEENEVQRIRKALKAAIDFINRPTLDDDLISMLDILEHNHLNLKARISTIRFEAKNKLYDILHGE